MNLNAHPRHVTIGTLVTSDFFPSWAWGDIPTLPAELSRPPGHPELLG